MISNVVRVAKSPLIGFSKSRPVQFVILPRAILRRALHIAGKLDTTDSTARFQLAHLVSLNRFRVNLNLNGAQHRPIPISYRATLNPNSLAAAYADESYVSTVMQQYMPTTVRFKCR